MSDGTPAGNVPGFPFTQGPGTTSGSTASTTTTKSNLDNKADVKTGIKKEYFRYGRRRKAALSIKAQRYLYRIRPRRPVSMEQRKRMQALGKIWGPVLRRARAIAKENGRGRITRKDYAIARREMNM